MKTGGASKLLSGWSDENGEAQMAKKWRKKRGDVNGEMKIDAKMPPYEDGSPQ